MLVVSRLGAEKLRRRFQWWDGNLDLLSADLVPDACRIQVGIPILFYDLAFFYARKADESCYEPCAHRCGIPPPEPELVY